jgi:tight adherence protein B
MLSHADAPLTAPEFTLIILGLAVVGFVFGVTRSSLPVGLLLAIVLGYFPIIYLRVAIGRRQRAFTDQLPDLLTLLVGALRAGYGLAQAIDVLVEQMPPPASGEFARVQRAVGLGLPIQTALNDMSQRIGTDEVDLVVTAINVQYEMGGNLAETLETIGETIRDRIRMLREIRVLTAQQRMTGYILAVLPFAVGLGMYVINPEYIMRLFEPGWIRILPIAALVMQVIGFLLIRRIVDIEV